MFDVLTDGKSITPKTPLQREAIERFTDVMLTIKYGIGPEQTAFWPQDYYDDLVLISNLRETKQAARNAPRVTRSPR